MPLLKAYKNLDLRPAATDALGRLTSDEERRIKSLLKTEYGDARVAFPLFKLDLALARSAKRRPCDMVIVLRNKELPVATRTDDPEAIAGALIGHLSTAADKAAFKSFYPLKQTVSLRKRMDRSIDVSTAVLSIDAFVNSSRYPASSMMAFLLRKLQASTFGAIPAMLCWGSTKIDRNLGNQMMKFGYRPYGIGDFENLRDPILRTGRCLAMYAARTQDSREIRK